VTESELCSLEEKEAALSKALHSRTFARSEQLKSFLRYICEAETLRPGAPLNEYVIGVEVLGRPEGYSPAEDSSVRTRAYELRQKLEKLYSSELPDEAVQIFIPKGTYSPHYLRRLISDPAPVPEIPHVPEPVVPSALPPVAPRTGFRGRLLLAVMVSALAGSVLTWLVVRPAVKAAEPDPTLVEAWGPLASDHSNVLLTVATPLSLIVGPQGHDVFGSNNYPAPPDAYPLFRAHRILPAGGRLDLTFSDNMLGVGTMNAALTCAHTLRNFGASYQLLPERVASVSALRGRNVILLGAAVDSEAIAVAMQDMPLAVEFDPAVREFVIRNRATGQAIAPEKDSGGRLSKVYGLITVKTSHDDRNRQQMVLMSGITSVGVQGAAEFFSSPNAMRLLRSKLGQGPEFRFPAAYQVIVQCDANNLLLLSSSYFAHQVISKD
jgi:hypothetical protein